MITADSNYGLYDGSELLYSALSIVVDYRYSAINDSFLVTIRPATVVASTTTPVDSFTISVTKTEVDSKTGTGTNPSDKIRNQIEQVVVDYLEPINTGVGFTIS